MKSIGTVLTLGMMLSVATGVARADGDNSESTGSPNIKCVSVKRINPQNHHEERGISIYYLSTTHAPNGKVINSEELFTSKLWFGESVSIRNQALVACEKGRTVLECRLDGHTHVSYFSNAVTKDWALHGPNLYETFSDPKIWGDSAYLQCQKRIIEHISGMIQQLQ